MIIVITGLTGSGKTELMTRLIHAEWNQGARIFTNYPLTFDENNTDIHRWHNLDELYNLRDGIITIDEGQKLFHARRWASTPKSFLDKITQHRKHNLDVYTTTQDLGQIDSNIRCNIHELWVCESLFRFPRNDRVKPLIMIVRNTKKRRVMTADTERIQWLKVGHKYHFISRYFTKELYNTYGDIGFERYLCKLENKLGKWEMKIYAQDLINQGKARL